MGRMSKEEMARMEGMLYAYRIASKDGVEALEEELKKRNITGISLNVSHKEMEKATEKMQEMLFDTFMCFTVGILHDRYGFGSKRAKEFTDHFNEGAALLQEGTITWQQIIDNTEDALGMKLSIRENNTNTRLKHIY